MYINICHKNLGSLYYVGVGLSSPQSYIRVDFIFLKKDCHHRDPATCPLLGCEPFDNDG